MGFIAPQSWRGRAQVPRASVGDAKCPCIACMGAQVTQSRGQTICKERKGTSAQGGMIFFLIMTRGSGRTTQGPRRVRFPLYHSRRQSRLRNNKDEGESKIRGSRRNDPPLLSMMTITSVGHLNEDDPLGNLNVKDLKSTLEGSSPWGSLP